MNPNDDTKFNRPLRYFVPPPFIDSTLVYQDVNTDKNLRDMMTEFYLKKSIKWVTSYPEFSHAKKSIKLLKSDSGYNVIYNLLREIVKKYNMNWYDLKKSEYSKVKDFLCYKLGKF